jgi:hypothetical protein
VTVFTESDFVQAEEYCLQRSWTLRRRPKESRWIVSKTVSLLPTKIPENLEQYEKFLCRLVSIDVREQYGNPVVVFVLLNVIVPLIVKLVIEWWVKRSGS